MTNPNDYEDLKKEVEYLRTLTKNQQDALDIYRKRFNRIKRSLRNPFYGMGFFLGYLKRKMWRHFSKGPDKEYDKLIREMEAEYDFTPVKKGPSIHIFVLTGEGTSPSQKTLESIAAQSYGAADYSLISRTEELKRALESVNADYVGFVFDGDILAPFALLSCVQATQEGAYNIIYSDEDCMDDKGRRWSPFFKSDFSPDSLICSFYTCRFSLYKKSALDFSGLWKDSESLYIMLYGLTLELSGEYDKICHIPQVLYHKKMGAPRFFDTDSQGLLDFKSKYFKEKGHSFEVHKVEETGDVRVTFDPGDALVSIIIPSKDNFDILKKCLDTLYGITSYKNFEVILVDNGSGNECREKILKLSQEIGFKYIYEPMEFNFSRMCNMGAEAAQGELLLFLNDDIEITHPEWLGAMAGYALLCHVGAVGAKLLYPGGHIIQHDGVMDLINGPVHALHFGDDRQVYYHGRNRLDYNVSAVTGACLLLRKEIFERVGGFDTELRVGYNDIDLCYKILEAGYYNVIRNDAVLIHHESVSRGYDDKNKKKHQRLLLEQRHLYLSHPWIMANDPFYSPNLTRTNTDFSINKPDSW